ncbi:MAG: Non-heme chloroperoxidase [Firmicutes bacterium ADurb.Bin182]|nr:MAG: Non-heme chloroperoxidase [Firmicutes bacterium ADurb.Bin182]
MLISLKGIDINFERLGSGKPVLILHGWGCSADTMRAVANYIAAVGREAVLLDFPGHGKSGKLSKPWGVDEYAELTEEFIERQKLRGCDALCHSFGARIAILLAAKDPGIFGKLIFTGAAGIRPKRGLKYYVKVYCFKLARTLSKVKFLDKLFRLTEKSGNAGSADYRALSGVMKTTFVKVVNKDLAPLLKNIGNETLLIWGSEDRETPLYMAKRMEREIKNSGLALIEGAGHFCFLDDYRRFCSIIKVMLEG